MLQTEIDNWLVGLGLAVRRSSAAQGDAMNPYAYDLDERDLKRERQKARALRQSQWWKRRCAKGRCHYCGRRIPAAALTMDHHRPGGQRREKHQGQCGSGVQVLQQQKKTTPSHGVGRIPANDSTLVVGQSG
jgi:5-methylcytosine-specific restriction protein A